jgi:hypothetical protein
VVRERFDVALCGWSLWCVPLEGVVHALRNIHAALADDGILVDTQPVSASPPVALDGDELGSLDMHAWLDTIHAVDERFSETIADGLYGCSTSRGSSSPTPSTAVQSAWKP